MKFRILLFLLLAISFRSFAIIGYDYGDTLTCLAYSGLKIRSEPNGTNVTGKVPYGGKVVVCAKPWGVNDNLLPFQAEGIQGSWVRIRYNDISGFVFDGFLSNLPAPSLQCKSLKQYASCCLSQSGKKNVFTHNCEGLTLGDTLQFFTWQSNFAIHEERFGYESWSETLTLQGVSAEECYLIAHIVYKSDIDSAVADMKNHPDKLGVVLQTDIDNMIEDYNIFSFQDGKYKLELMGDGCYDVIMVIKLSDNIFQICRSSGC
jgi:hypothetical protein